MDNNKKSQLAAARVWAQVAFLTKIIKDKNTSALTKKKALAKLDHIRQHGSLDGSLTDVYR